MLIELRQRLTMRLNDTLLFGKFKGLRIINVFQGTNNIDQDILSHYVRVMLNINSMQGLEETFGAPFSQLIDEFEVTNNKIKVVYGGKSDRKIRIGNLENNLQEYLTMGQTAVGRIFFRSWNLNQPFSLEDVNALREKKSIIGAAPDYICWGIANENFKKFYIEPEDLEAMEGLEIYIFCGINVTHLGNDLYEYAPNIQTKTYTFSKEIKAMNEAKAMGAKSKNIMSGNNSKIDLQTSNQDDLIGADWQYDRNNPAHNPSENPWIEIFGPGDEAETAYWNTD